MSRYALLELALVVVPLAGLFALVIPVPLYGSAFSSAEWIRGDAQVRGRMGRDLIASQQLMGKSVAQVLTILGSPDVEHFGGQTFRFQVEGGSRSALKSCLSDLVIRFGKGNEVFQITLEPREEM